MENIETGYGKLTGGLLTVAGGGRSFGVLGEGNAHYKNGSTSEADKIDVN